MPAVTGEQGGGRHTPSPPSDQAGDQLHMDGAPAIWTHRSADGPSRAPRCWFIPAVGQAAGQRGDGQCEQELHPGTGPADGVGPGRRPRDPARRRLRSSRPRILRSPSPGSGADEKQDGQGRRPQHAGAPSTSHGPGSTGVRYGADPAPAPGSAALRSGVAAPSNASSGSDRPLRVHGLPHVSLGAPNAVMVCRQFSSPLPECRLLRRRLEPKASTSKTGHNVNRAPADRMAKARITISTGTARVRSNHTDQRSRRATALETHRHMHTQYNNRPRSDQAIQVTA